MPSSLSRLFCSTMSLHLSHDLRLFHYAHAPDSPVVVSGAASCFLDKRSSRDNVTHQLLQFTAFSRLSCSNLLPGSHHAHCPRFHIATTVLPSFHKSPNVAGRTPRSLIPSRRHRSLTVVSRLNPSNRCGCFLQVVYLRQESLHGAGQFVPVSQLDSISRLTSTSAS